jgi:hypothetical protein
MAIIGTPGGGGSEVMTVDDASKKLADPSTAEVRSLR